MVCWGGDGVCRVYLRDTIREAIPRNQNLNRTNCTFNRLFQAASQTIVRELGV